MEVVTGQLSKEELLLFLSKVDSYFQPEAISKRVNLTMYSEKLANSATHFYVMDNTLLVGVCCCYMNDVRSEKAFISITCVHPDYFGKGIGKMLTVRCEDEARCRNLKCVEFEVHFENFPSIKMHEQLGYLIDRKIGNSFYMKKML